jgi:dipeptidyl aminopeptidase/acylaminoacyl peptidase
MSTMQLIVTASLRAALFAALVFMSPVYAQDQHNFTVDDWSRLRSANAIAVSPDGKTILYRVQYSGDRGPGKREWYLIGSDGNNRHKLELPEHFTPSHFTLDGSLYGLYRVEKLTQLAIVPLVPGKSTQIIALPRGVTSATLSPDGSKFVILADPRGKDDQEDVRHIVENELTSIYVVNANGGGGSWWCSALMAVNRVAWSSASSELAVLSSFPKIGHHDVRSSIDLCTSSGIRHVADIQNAVAGLAWAAGGRELAFASTTTEVLTPDHLWTVSLEGGSPVDRTPKLAGSITDVSNDAHGTVLVELHDRVITDIASYANGAIERLYHYPDGSISGLPAYSLFPSAPEVLAFTVGDPNHSPNVALFGRPWQRLTAEGDEQLSSVKLGEVRIVNWTSKDGSKLEGIATFPADYQAPRKYPFLVLPHGGPEANDVFHFDVFARLIAGMGYVVLQPEYRGSTGYGSDFLGAIYQHFGDRAYADVDSATDFAVAQGWADPNRLAIFGWSAGGFMTSWTVTQTQRYKAAIEGAGITDWLSFIPTSDIAQVDYDARWQEKDPAPLLKFSAVMFADKVTTPLLILHGEADLRVPALQGREFFVLLAERGKTVKMVTYPGSPHFPALAEQRRDVFRQINDWLAKYNR